MVAKLKSKFFPQKYEISLFKKMQKLKQKESSVEEYTQEFYRLNIQAGHVDEDVEQVSRYLNGLPVSIQYEISMDNAHCVEEAYQFALKAEGKLNRKQQSNSRGRGRFSRGRGQSSSDRSSTSKQEETCTSSACLQGGRGRGDFLRGKEGYSHGRGSFGRGRERIFSGTCYQCGETRHQAFECPQIQYDGRKGKEARVHVVEAEDQKESPPKHGEDPEDGESLMLRRVLLNPEKEKPEPTRRRNLFRT
ncbi:uncharacterized protein LOC131855992 [Cryptomeria japonica]|uniref:uncharacterized protein LOC131855992 n=1 Tax=Cryptomeria japonica TaxID=3369 RepID=UPI0027DA4980|nr:uncharacterized protein LOC131855992 [Cryptomeria japonica]